MDLEEVESTEERPGPESPEEQDHDGSRSFPSQLVSLTEGDAVTDVDHGPGQQQLDTERARRIAQLKRNKIVSKRDLTNSRRQLAVAFRGNEVHEIKHWSGLVTEMSERVLAQLHELVELYDASNDSKAAASTISEIEDVDEKVAAVLDSAENQLARLHAVEQQEFAATRSSKSQFSCSHRVLDLDSSECAEQYNTVQHDRLSSTVTTSIGAPSDSIDGLSRLSDRFTAQVSMNGAINTSAMEPMPSGLDQAGLNGETGDSTVALSQHSSQSGSMATVINNTSTSGGEIAAPTSRTVNAAAAQQYSAVQQPQRAVNRGPAMNAQKSAGTSNYGMQPPTTYQWSTNSQPAIVAAGSNFIPGGPVLPSTTSRISNQLRAAANVLQPSHASHATHATPQFSIPQQMNGPSVASQQWPNQHYVPPARIASQVYAGPIQQPQYGITNKLNSIEIPTFDGNKRSYEPWKATFMACIHNAAIEPTMKLLQLRQYLSGDALKCIEQLGYSPEAYVKALERLERKFGGQRRQVAVQLEELERFPPLQRYRAQELERLADLLDVAVVNLKSANRTAELENGTFYTRLLTKLSKAMLAQYQRWLYEQRKREHVESLLEWLNLEAEFQTTASEVIDGIQSSSQPSRANTHSGHSRPRETGGYRPPSNVTQSHSFLNDVSEKKGKMQCPECNGSHRLWECEKFLQLPVGKRWLSAKNHRVCYRCLTSGHSGRDCTNGRKCGIDNCSFTHNRLLHGRDSVNSGSSRSRATAAKSPARVIERQAHEQTSRSTTTEHSATTLLSMEGEESSSKKATFAASTANLQEVVGLRTVPVILHYDGKDIATNALLDDGSTATFLNTKVAAELGLVGDTQEVTVDMLNGKHVTFSSELVTVRLKSPDGTVDEKICARTADRIAANLPVVDWKQHASSWQHLSHIEFPRINRRRPIDLLIGIDNAQFHRCKAEVTGGDGEPIARLSPLGWTCVGKPSPSEPNPQRTVHSQSFLVNKLSRPEADNNLERLVRKFWEVEDYPSSNNILTKDEKEAVRIVTESLTYTDSGRYTVGIPWKRKPPSVPNSYAMAMKRLKSTEKRLKDEPKWANEYRQVFQKYLEKGYVSRVHQPSKQRAGFCLSHFPIVRLGRETTKVRVVFDAAAKVDGESLNSYIHPGPKLQRCITDVLLKFREKPVALGCDVTEMYLQIQLKEEDKQFHRFLWRTDPTQEPEVWEFNRVAFGVSASPFLAQYVSQQHAKKHQEEYPMAAEAILSATYMDDTMTSVEDDREGVQMYQELTSLWQSAGMHPRKWLSSSIDVLRVIPQQDRASQLELDDTNLPTVKTLGVRWEAANDQFTFFVSEIDDDNVVSKRFLLKKIATIFDPLGFLGPFTVRAKIVLQSTWLEGYDWDEALGPTLQQRIRQWFDELPLLQNVKVQRALRGRQPITKHVHVFVDASQNAFGAVAYLVVTHADGTVTSRLMVSRNRVAPLSAVSIPRLELMAAVLGVEMMKPAAVALGMSLRNQVTFWSDSSDVLYWIKSASRKFKPFVAHRVSLVQENTEPAQWRHIPTQANPADHLTRGLSATDLATSSQWWHGPAFLTLSESEWPITNLPGSNSAATLSELRRSEGPVERAQSSATVQCHQVSVFLNRLQPENHSDLTRYVRLRAWINRFLVNFRLPRNRCLLTTLTNEEMSRAETDVIRESQQRNFDRELKELRNGRPVAAVSKLASLTPYLDDDGVIRCGGRLQLAQSLRFETRSPIILARNDPVSTLIVKHHHERLNHVGGTNHVLAMVSAKYWIIAAREAIRNWERKCNKCRRLKARAGEQIMAPIPDHRIQDSLRAFCHTAVDFAGPFLTKAGRGRPRWKRYMCLFTCTATRAVHIEMAYDLTTDGFVSAFSRFTSRRGVPDQVTSDNGTNFVGAVSELKELVNSIDTAKVVNSKDNQYVVWNFNPPAGPHFGGIHESLIKSAKRAVYGILKDADIRDEELMTCFTAVEGILNSRPLTFHSANPADDTPLTPNHFLHGQVGGVFAPAIERGRGLLPRWRRIQELLGHFWKRFMTEWVPFLNPRAKWRQQQRDLKPGDIVIVPSPDTPRGRFPLARVTEVMPGRDAHVRVVKLQLGDKLVTRPICKVCPLLDSNDK